MTMTHECDHPCSPTDIRTKERGLPHRVRSPGRNRVEESRWRNIGREALFGNIVIEIPMLTHS